MLCLLQSFRQHSHVFAISMEVKLRSDELSLALGYKEGETPSLALSKA